jgi:hypothetical protein
MMASPVLPPTFTPELIEFVQKQIDKAATGEKTIIWEQIVARLFEANLATIEECPPQDVGVHKDNRFKMGVDTTRSQTHGADVLETGFSFEKCKDATSFETPPHPWDQQHVDFNEKLRKESAGLLPELRSLKMLSMGATHTNVFCRQVKAGVVSKVPKLADEDGNLNYERLTIGRPTFKQACDKGLKWCKLHWGCEFAWPKLAALGQDALNVIARNPPNEIEIMMNLCMRRRDILESGEKVDWAKLIAAASHGNPPCTPYMHAIAKYVENHSGGIDAELIADLCAFQKLYASSEKIPKTLGGEYIHKVASLTFGPSEAFPYVVHALLKTNLSSKKSVDGICRLLLPSSVSQIASKPARAKVKEA